MNIVTLQKLLDICVKEARRHTDAKDKLDKFCEKNWGFLYTDSNDIGIIDGLADAVDYGTRDFKAEDFVEIMNQVKENRN